MMHEGEKLTSCNSMPSSQFFPPNFLLQMQTLHEDHQDHHPPTSLTQLLPPSDPRDYQGVTTFLGKRSMSFPGLEACEEATGEDDLSDDCSQLGEKKRRLNMEQVKTLEKNFELGNKLEPERKIQLARALGLQPRQIAIWFQNRRARWKTKQLEKDYDVLKRQFEALKSDNDVLQAHNKKLQAEIMALKGMESPEPINLNKENEGSYSNRSDNSSDLNLGMSRTQATPESPPNSHPSTNRSFLQSHRPTSMTQLHHNSSSSSRPDLMHCPKGEHGAVQDESFCNMFTNLDDQTGFWSALHEQQNFH